MKHALTRRTLALAIGTAVGVGLVGPITPAHAAQIITVRPGQQIQAAINQAVDGDSVRVYPGVYNENLDFVGKKISVEGIAGANQTIIDGRGLDSVVRFTRGEVAAARLIGFTIRNGNRAGDGGGILIDGASPTIQSNIIKGNQACASGAGISAGRSSSLISGNIISGNRKTPGCSGGLGGGVLVHGAGAVRLMDNVITNNEADSAGGVGLNSAGDPIIERNRISANRALDRDGGGIEIINDTRVLLRTNIISANSAAGRGGGIAWLIPADVRGPVVTSNTVAANTAGRGGQALFADGFQAAVPVQNNVFTSDAIGTVVCGNFARQVPLFKHDDAFANRGVAWDNSCGNIGQQNNNISLNPMYRNPAASDFRVNAGSPVIDRGTNAAPGIAPTDFDGRARVSDGNGDGQLVTDMGAFEL